MSTFRTAMRLMCPVLVLLSMAALFLPTGGGSAPVPDKVIHVIIFAGLTGNGVLAQFRRSWLLSSLLSYAVLSEIIQGLLPFNRSADWRDALADIAGILVGFVAGHFVQKALDRAPSISSEPGSVRRAPTA